ncbi:MAG TPA: outer membrane protein assembly factor BamE [Telluria sp.]|nr:outer membrane protein assembly factor BamE [Telluria sp.]
MRVPAVVTPRSITRASALALALLALSGCASQKGELKDGVAVSAPVQAQSQADAAESAAAANAGATTTKASRLQKFMWFFSPYRPDIQQGNFVSQEMLTQLKVGLTREQVRFVLGTPLLTDVFHADRWDYPFRLERGNGELTTSRVTVYFKDDKVERFDGGNLPTEREYIERIAGPIRKQETAGAAKVDPSSISAQARETARGQ